MKDEDFYQAKIAGLENDNLMLRKSLRDQFTMAAVTGILAAKGDKDGMLYFDSKAIADAAFDVADAMLARRLK